MSEEEHIPQLRFPEFGEEWDKVKLNDVLTLLTDFEANGSFASVKENVTVFDEENYAWYVRATDLEKNTNLENVRYVDEHSYTFLRKTPLFGQELLITKRGEIGKVYFFNPKEYIKATLAPNLYLLKLNEKVDSKFIYLFFINEKGNKKLKRINASSTIGALYKDDVKAIKMVVPSRPEQEKIASFLTAVDTKIEQLGKKQELLGEYKKGLMQQIFSQEIRFKADDGSDFPDWEEKRLDDIAEIVGGGTPPTAVEKYWGGDIQWFTPTEIKSKYIVNSKRTITQVGLDTSSAKLLPKGTLLFSSRATVGEVGIAVQECTTNQGFQSFIVNKNNEPEFLYNWIIKNKKEFIRRASGSTFLEIGKSEIKKIKLHIPALPEQTKIANFLSSIDNKIEQVGKQLDESRQFKKALLQQMFV
jgi:type I restriction enzyme S subunit